MTRAAGPTVCVVVSTYNTPDTLARVLAAYLAQAVPPHELIVADDGSDQRTLAVVGDFAARSPFSVRHVWHEDLGFRAAKIRNEAVKSSSSDYIIFTDGDCLPHPRFVQDHLRHAERGYFVQGKRILVSEHLTPDIAWRGSLAHVPDWLRGDLSGGHRLIRVPALASRSTKMRGVRSCNLGVFRDDLFAINGYNEDFVGWGREDSELVARLYIYGLRRKDPLFSAMVLHLWHPQASRDQLTHNDVLLDQTLSSGGYRCLNGLVKQSEENCQ